RELAAHLAGARELPKIDAPAPCANAREAAARLPPPIFVQPPGVAFEPSRAGYVLLSAVLQGASGEGFAALPAETGAAPAGLRAPRRGEGRPSRRHAVDAGRRPAAIPAGPHAVLRARLVRSALVGARGGHELPLRRRRARFDDRRSRALRGGARVGRDPAPR